MPSGNNPKRTTKSQTGSSLAKRCVVGALLSLAFLVPAVSASARSFEDFEPTRPELFAGNPYLPMYPPAGPATRDHLAAPPSENQYFYIRPDGQPYFVNLDGTVNMTDAINRFYFNPACEGEVWAPVDFCTILERSSRTMATWPDYDEFSKVRRLNGVHKFIEAWSGYGP